MKKIQESRPVVIPRMARLWAKGNGYEVGERGRLPKHITEAYRAEVLRTRTSGSTQTKP